VPTERWTSPSSPRPAPWHHSSSPKIRGYGGDQQAMFELSAEVLYDLGPEAPALCCTSSRCRTKTLAAAYQGRQAVALERIPELRRLWRI
jgi:hypothetical protein